MKFIFLKFKQLKNFTKHRYKLVVIKLISNFKFLDSVIKYSKGIGWQGSLLSEINSLVGKDSNRFILFDIGANIGSYSLIVADLFPRSTIYSFEPSKASFDLLEKNTKLNLQINCVQTAFGEDTKQVNLYSDQIASGMASFFNRDLNAIGIKFNPQSVNKDQLFSN